MTTKTLYFDEAGFTGHNLLDPDQPVFAIASADLQPEKAEAILKSSFPKYQGDEFKFSNIWKTKNRERLIEFSGQLAGLEESVFTWINHKKYTVLALMVDYLIEPYVTATGHDFYADGFCWKYTNYIYVGLVNFAPPELLDSLVRDYQAFSRQPTSESLEKLQYKLETMVNSIPEDEPYRIFIEQFAMGADLFKRFHNVDIFKSTNEIHVSAMVATIAHWRKRNPEDFAVVHDASANFFRHMDMWERITNHDVPQQLHRGGDGEYVEFPLRVTSTIPQDSRDSYPIQFCDVISGFAAKHFNPDTTGDDRKFLDEVVKAGMGNLLFNGLRPALIFPDRIPPRELSGPDVVDQMVEIIYGDHNKKA